MKNRILTIDNAIVFVLSLLIMSFVAFNISTDIETHVLQIIKINNGEAGYLANFFYYVVVNVISLFSRSVNTLLNIAVLVLSLAITAKYVITKHIVRISLQDQLVKREKANLIVVLAALGLIFMFAIPDYTNLFILTDRYYLGRIVPNVWHNSTTIFLFPFALLLYFKQRDIIVSEKDAGVKDIIVICVLSILNIIIKPSFFFVFMPVTSLFLLLKYRFSKKFFFNMIPMFLGLFLILVQYILIYKFQQGSFHEEKSSVILSKPFVVWSIWLPLFYIPVALIMSNIFPILFFSYNFRSILDKKYLYPVLMSLAALLMFIFVREQGARAGDGNFMWQNVITQYILMMVCSIEVLREILKVGIKNTKLKILAGAFLLHVLAGIGYIIKIYYTGSVL